MSKKHKNKKRTARPVSKSTVITWVVIGVLIAALIGVWAFVLSSTGDKTSVGFTSTENTSGTAHETNEKISENKEDPAMTDEKVKVLVEMENGEDFTLELYPEYAPQTVQNFVDLVTDGFYDGVGFHRVVDGFMAQGGDPEGTGMGGSGTNIPGEFSANGFTQNTLSHTRGVISMARSQDPDSASSQFFICYDDASFLDGNYAAFGKVVEGMETVDGFLDVKRTANSMGELASPTEPIIMKRVTIID